MKNRHTAVISNKDFKVELKSDSLDVLKEDINDIDLYDSGVKIKIKPSSDGGSYSNKDLKMTDKHYIAGIDASKICFQCAKKLSKSDPYVLIKRDNKISFCSPGCVDVYLDTTLEPSDDR